MKDAMTIWVLALAEFNQIEMHAFRTRREALEALRRAADEADAWDAEGESRFSEALATDQFEVAECIAGNQIRSTHLRWEMRKFDMKDYQATRRNCDAPLI